MNWKKRALRTKVENRIREAFKGVTLGDGISLHQTVIVNNYGRDDDDNEVSDLEWERRRSAGVIDNWEKIDFSREPEDDDFAIAHLDDEALRYYLPALMISVIEIYDPGSMRVIGTLDSLYPRKAGEMARYWDSTISTYSTFTDEQKAAIALFLEALPEVVQLNTEDSRVVERALRNYWDQFVPEEDD
ncbi:MAG TPA: DUF6714 family protein [Aridibacter sp.]|nr:DUF6714 family protein [Aridibacter sp.]